LTPHVCRRRETTGTLREGALHAIDDAAFGAKRVQRVEYGVEAAA